MIALFGLTGLVACVDYGFNWGDRNTPEGEDEPLPVCDDFAIDPPVQVETPEACTRPPYVGSFEPEIEWQWSVNPLQDDYDGVMSTPVVGHLDDDNGDGEIGFGDVPEIVFTAFAGGFYARDGVLIALRGNGRGLVWTVDEVEGLRPSGVGGAGLGDLDGDGYADVCTNAEHGGLICVRGTDGAPLWVAETDASFALPSFADLDKDGINEVIHGRQIFDASGNSLGIGALGNALGTSVAADWDGDGQLDVIVGNAVYASDGSTLQSVPRDDGFIAIADFNADGRPDRVVVVDGVIRVDANDGELLWSSEIPGGCHGGSPTVDDFDHDGLPEVGVAGRSFYSVFEHDGTLKWSRDVQDESSCATGSTVFDFQGDGAAEVVYADEETLWIIDGTTGQVLMEESGHASATYLEYPVVADVDGDGETEIVLGSNDFAWPGWHGITVLGDAGESWAVSRPVWNQFAYHITNVEDDASIATDPQEHWLQENSFRAAGNPRGPDLPLADLIVQHAGTCGDECWDGWSWHGLQVGNVGEAEVGGFVVELFGLEGDQEIWLGSFTISGLAAGAWEGIGPFPVEVGQFAGDTLRIRVDPLDTIAECEEDNNELELAWPCGDED